MDAPSLAGTRLDRYFHVCGFFSSQKAEYRVLGPFYREGIDAGDKVLTIVDPTRRRDHLAELERSGIDASRAGRRGQLEVLDWNEVYLENGAFDPDRMLRHVEAAIAAGREQGFARCRITGHMGWALEGMPGSDQLIEYEVRVNDVLARTRQPAVCIYDTDRLTGPMMMDILRSHPLTLVGGIVQENPFFTPPDMFLNELRSRRRAAPLLQ